MTQRQRISASILTDAEDFAKNLASFLGVAEDSAKNLAIFWADAEDFAKFLASFSSSCGGFCWQASSSCGGLFQDFSKILQLWRIMAKVYQAFGDGSPFFSVRMSGRWILQLRRTTRVLPAAIPRKLASRYSLSYVTSALPHLTRNVRT